VYKSYRRGTIGTVAIEPLEEKQMLPVPESKLNEALELVTELEVRSKTCADPIPAEEVEDLMAEIRQALTSHNPELYERWFGEVLKG
jgi:hypothetical protein